MKQVKGCHGPAPICAVLAMTVCGGPVLADGPDDPASPDPVAAVAVATDPPRADRPAQTLPRDRLVELVAEYLEVAFVREPQESRALRLARELPPGIVQ